jgi:hypothetical protein
MVMELMIPTVYPVLCPQELNMPFTIVGEMSFSKDLPRNVGIQLDLDKRFQKVPIP